MTACDHITGPRREIAHRLEFREEGEFEAHRMASNWCESHGFSVGRMQGSEPRGLMRGEFLVQKWRNLNREHRAALVGHMTGRPRTGPVVVTIYAEGES